MEYSTAIHRTQPYTLPFPGMETMGDRIRQLRIARGLSYRGLGKLCGVGGGAVFQWETGGTKDMKNATFVLLCQALNTDPQYLLWGEDRKPPAESPAARAPKKKA